METVYFVTNRNQNLVRDPDDFGTEFQRDSRENLHFGWADVDGGGRAQAIVGNPKATTLDVAQALVQIGCAVVRERLPRKPARSAFGFQLREKYWLHRFDVQGVEVATSR